MCPCGVAPAELLETLAEGEMGVVGGRVDLEQPLERRPGAIVLAGVVVRPAERLEDAGFAGLFPVGPLEDHRCLGEVALGQEVLAALKQLVRRLAVVARNRVVGVGGGLFGTMILLAHP